MRKLLLLSFLIFTAIAHGRQISESEAEAVATQFLNRNLTATVKQTKIVRQAAKHHSAQTASDPYYVFNAGDNCGFVIISGDDRAKRILGYSDTGHFDFSNIPPQLKDLLNQYAGQIKSLPAEASTDPSWSESPEGQTTGEEVILETANWGQGAPYNSLCPMIDGLQAPTGCVATAMAIIMKYHNWPEQGKGSHSYNWNSTELTFDYQTDFEWDKIPDNPNSFSENDVKENLAKLMLACGVAIDMNYGLNESSAYNAPVSIAMTKYFKYTPLSQHLLKQCYTDDEWEALLKYELNQKRPFIYFAAGNHGGHAFVCDGYKDSYFHINWGWDGELNGYFVLNYLNPYSSDSDGAYNKDVSALIGILPDKHETGIPVSPLCIYPVGLTSDSSDFGSGTKFKLTAKDISCNDSGFTGKVAALLTDMNGNIKQILSEQDLILEGATSKKVVFHDCSIKDNLENGDLLTIASKDQNNDKWEFIIRQPWNLNSSAIYPQVYNAQYGKVVLDVDQGVTVELFDEKMQPVEMDRIPFGTSLKAKVGFDDSKKLFTIQFNHHDFGDIYVTLPEDNILPLNSMCQPYYNLRIRLYDESDLRTRHIHVESAGSLGSLLTDDDKLVGTLSMSGKINFGDLVVMEECLPLLTSIDMGECSYIDDTGGGIQCFNNRRFLKKVILPKDLKQIGIDAFSNSGIETISIPDGIESIGFGAFSECKKLQSISLPESLNSLAQLCFNGCSNLKEVTLPSGLTTVPVNAFSDCTSLKTVKLQNNILQIDNHAFYGCTALESIDLGCGLTCIGELAFGECTALKDIDLPKTLTEIGTGAFWNNTLLQKIVIPNSVTSIGRNAFYNCSNVSSLILGDNLRTIEESTFMGCNGYSSLVLGKNVTHIGQSAFAGNYKDLYLNSNLEYVASFGFSSQTSIESVYSPAIRSFELENDDALRCQTIYVPGHTAEKFHNIPCSNIVEMWSYEINKTKGLLRITPKIEGLVIDNVAINGTDAQCIDGVYSFDSKASVPTVEVKYTLHGYQQMSTIYDASFNAPLDDTELSSIDEILPDSDRKYSIFNLQGVMLGEGCDESDLKRLDTGIYIIKQGSNVRKIIVQ